MKVQKVGITYKKKVLILTSVASMIDQFNRPNIMILLDLGYNVDVACNYVQGSTCSDEVIAELKRELEKRGVRCIQIDFTRSVMDFRQDLIALRQVRHLCKENKYEFIHCQSPIGGVIGRIAAKQTATKVIYTAHGFHFFEGAPKRNWLMYYPIEKQLSRITDVLITINHEDYNRAKNKFHAKKTVYIPGVGVDTKKFATCPVTKEEKRIELGIPSNAFVLLSVGELQSNKNQKVVIEAINKLDDKDSVIYLLVGQGELENEYRELIKLYNLESQVWLMGCRKDVGELCEAADVFIHLSIREGLGISPMEAMAAGLPIISANRNGIKDYMENGKTGICIDPIDVGEIVKAINCFKNDLLFLKQCGRYNADKAKEFDMAYTDKIVEKIYQDGYCHLIRQIIRKQKREEMGLKNDDFVLLSVGELNENKNHKVVVEGVRRCNTLSIKYIICGIGPLKEQLERQILDFKLENQVYVLGFRSDIKELLWMSDAFVFPSKREGLGLAGIEAMSAGLPLITSNIHGIKDYSINGVTGYALEKNEAEEYKRAIKKIIRDKYMKYRFGENCELRSKLFDVKIVNKIMKQEYAEGEQ